MKNYHVTSMVAYVNVCATESNNNEKTCIKVAASFSKCINGKPLPFGGGHAVLWVANAWVDTYLPMLEKLTKFTEEGEGAGYEIPRTDDFEAFYFMFEDSESGMRFSEVTVDGVWYKVKSNGEPVYRKTGEPIVATPNADGTTTFQFAYWDCGDPSLSESRMRQRTLSQYRPAMLPTKADVKAELKRTRPAAGEPAPIIDQLTGEVLKVE